jgi:predicted nucleic acid-binding protein
MGQLAIPPAAKVYADTSVFIYTVEANSTYYNLLQPLWARFQGRTIELVTSELSLMETLVVPLRDSNVDLVNTYDQLLLSPPLRLLPISQLILRDAANVRATTRLKTPDAIHAATALREGCTLFLTNDAQFRTIANLPVTVLQEVLTA